MRLSHSFRNQSNLFRVPPPSLWVQFSGQEWCRRSSRPSPSVRPSVRAALFLPLLLRLRLSSSPAFHVGFSIPIQRGASEPNYYDSSPPDSVGLFDLPPFSMIPRYLGRLRCPEPGLEGASLVWVEEERTVRPCTYIYIYTHMCVTTARGTEQRVGQRNEEFSERENRR